MKSAIPSILAFTGAAVAGSVAPVSDADPAVWANLKNVQPRASLSHASNRPHKRQDGWNPPSDLAAPLKEVWDHTTETYNNGDAFGFKNYGWDQIMATQG